MITLEEILCIALLVLLLSPSWFLPRKFGVIGFFLAHVSISMVTIFAILSDFIRGVVPDPDFIWLFGNFCWIGLANFVLLPLTIFATIRHYAHKRNFQNVV